MVKKLTVVRIRDEDRDDEKAK